MAVSSVYSSLFTTATSGVPTAGRPFTPPVGVGMDAVTYTMATTSLDDAGDFVGLIPVPIGKTLMLVGEVWADLDSGGTALDEDLVLRTVSKTGTTTDTIIVNHGTALSAAVTTVLWTVVNALISNNNSSATDYAYLGYLNNVAATAAASGAVTLIALWR